VPKITIIKIIHFTIDFLLAGFYNYFLNDTIYMEFAKKADGGLLLHLFNNFINSFINFIDSQFFAIIIIKIA
jgi:hypothetical protein